MKTMKVSDATYRAIADAAVLPFRSTGDRLPDGDWLVPVEDDTYERIQDARLPGESNDDTLQRLLHVYFGRSSNRPLPNTDAAVLPRAAVSRSEASHPDRLEQASQ